MKRLIISLVSLLMMLSAFAADRLSSLPYPILGGELSNSAATSVTDIDEVMPRMRALGLNTVLVPAYWELMEPVEGKFDFTLIDRTITWHDASSCMWCFSGLVFGRTRCRAIRPAGSSRTRSVSHGR